ncbi:hypothetical protein Nepgr_026806 [Nepenthes gracilis]|uniref:Uncharacterized protein n=1 Tax=Nepenthes gracilis TaxID=150966 RepID=A0AAD3T7U2_NEPGR|nr:hypothetical protein Nepgr_026806 [Nepenthes gracilis]
MKMCYAFSVLFVLFAALSFCAQRSDAAIAGLCEFPPFVLEGCIEKFCGSICRNIHGGSIAGKCLNGHTCCCGIFVHKPSP